ncbi:MAG: hypothetical protein K0Q47_38 [Sedimentibacter sp.]|jgi:hypothetical protein|nr:hypothetical protein [Sedimentibacter sp.]
MAIVVEEITLIKLLKKFIKNAPTYRNSSRVGNQRSDATLVATESCIFYKEEYDEENGFHDVEYKILFLSCYGIEIKIMKQKEVYIHAYWDDGWKYGNTEHTRYNAGRKFSKICNQFILNILETAEYVSTNIDSAFQFETKEVDKLKHYKNESLNDLSIVNSSNISR